MYLKFAFGKHQWLSHICRMFRWRVIKGFFFILSRNESVSFSLILEKRKECHNLAQTWVFTGGITLLEKRVKQGTQRITYQKCIGIKKAVSVRHRLQTADCRPWVKCRLRVKCKLKAGDQVQNADSVLKQPASLEKPQEWAGIEALTKNLQRRSETRMGGSW